MPVRRVWTLIRGLPADSAYAHALNPTLGVWDDQRELLANLIELVDEGNRLTYAVATGGKQLRKPIRVPRPGALRLKATPREIARFFGATPPRRSDG